MSLVYQAFIYGYSIDSSNNKIYFQEPADISVREAIIPSGSYSLDTLRQEIMDLLNDNGTDVYTVTVNRASRTFTISATGNFDLLPSTDTDSVFSTIGITSDQTGSNTYTGDTTGNIYYPQFPVQNYTRFEDKIVAINGNQTKSFSGIARASSLGRIRVMECSFQWITEIDFGCNNSPLKTNTNAFQDTRDFLDFCIDKNRVEFIPDTSDFDTYNVCVLTRTNTSRDGLDYELESLDNINMPLFRRVSNLEWQEVS